MRSMIELCDQQLMKDIRACELELTERMAAYERVSARSADGRSLAQEIQLIDQRCQRAHDQLLRVNSLIS